MSDSMNSPTFTAPVVNTDSNNIQVSAARIIGYSVNSDQQLTENPSLPLIAYPASPLSIVLFNYERKQQEEIVTLNDFQALPVACLRWSHCGRYLAIFQSSAVKSWLTVWDQRKSRVVISRALDCHSAVRSVAFSADGRRLTVLCQNKILEMQWRSGTNLQTLFNVSSPKQSLRGMASHADNLIAFGDQILVSIKPHEVKQADIGTDKIVSTSIGRDNVNTGKVFALSSSRRLLVFSSGLQLESWIELPPDEEHFSVSVTERFIALASSRSQFRLFDADTFEFRRKAPQPLRLLRHSSRLDCRYLRFLTHAEDDLQIFTGFSDNSFAIYDVSSASGESKEICSSNPPHNAPVEVLKAMSNSKFISASFDGSIRLWNNSLPERVWYFNRGASGNPSKRNQYRFIHIITGTTCAIFAEISGSLVIIDLASDTDEVVTRCEVHLGEVLCSDVFNGADGKLLIVTGSRDKCVGIVQVSIVKSENNFRKISLDLVQVIDIHTSSVTGVRFAFHTYPLEADGRLQVISCGIDCTILKHELKSSSEQLKFDQISKLALPSAIYSMAIDPTHRYLACVDQQFQIHAIRIADLSLLQTRPLMNSSIDAGHLFSRLSFDPSGTYLAIYASDLSLTHSVFRILQFFSGVLLSHIPSTHGFVRAIEWADDCTAIITADSSSAITCWHINSKLAIDEMQQRLEKMRYRVAPRSALPADAVGYLPRWLIRLQRGSADESAGIEHSLTSSNDKLRAVYCFPGETVEENDNELDLNISAVPVEPPSPQELRIENDFRFTILSPNEKLQSPFNANFMVDSFTDSLEPALPSDIETQTSPSFNPIEGQIIATQTSPIDAMPYIEALKLETTKPGSPRSVTDSRARQLRRALTNDKSRAKRAEIDIEQTFRMTSGLLDKLLQQSADSGAAVSYLAQLRVKLQTK